MALTFKGGIHVPEHKNTNMLAIEDMPFPKYVSIPLQQHIGAPAKSLVQKGDAVKLGQVIAKFDDALSCPVHASVSGIVTEIERRNSYSGYGKVEHIVIKNDFADTISENIFPYSGGISNITAEEIISIVKNAGISGMGGATFPTYAKIQSAIGKANEVIINCAECEPFITANHRLILENPLYIIEGTKLILKALNLHHAIFAIEDNKKDAANVLRRAIGNDKTFEIKILKTKYPQGDERQIIKAIKNIELPAGKLPAEVGCVVFNAETCTSIYNAFSSGLPLIKRIVTIDGDCIRTPKNIRVPLGTSYEDIVEFCGGFSQNPSKIISGGPMMGTAQWDINSVVMKGTSAILFLSEKFSEKESSACIHCGKCISSCPMRLMPNYLAIFSSVENLEMCEKYNILSCVECGCCTFTCPSNIPIVQHIRVAKGKIMDIKKKKQVAATVNN